MHVLRIGDTRNLERKGNLDAKKLYYLFIEMYSSELRTNNPEIRALFSDLSKKSRSIGTTINKQVFVGEIYELLLAAINGGGKEEYRGDLLNCSEGIITEQLSKKLSEFELTVFRNRYDILSIVGPDMYFDDAYDTVGRRDFYEYWLTQFKLIDDLFLSGQDISGSVHIIKAFYKELTKRYVRADILDSLNEHNRCITPYIETGGYNLKVSKSNTIDEAFQMNPQLECLVEMVNNLITGKVNSQKIGDLVSTQVKFSRVFIPALISRFKSIAIAGRRWEGENGSLPKEDQLLLTKSKILTLFMEKAGAKNMNTFILNLFMMYDVDFAKALLVQFDKYVEDNYKDSKQIPLHVSLAYSQIIAHHIIHSSEDGELISALIRKYLPYLTLYSLKCILQVSNDATVYFDESMIAQIIKNTNEQETDVYGIYADEPDGNKNAHMETVKTAEEIVRLNIQGDGCIPRKPDIHMLLGYFMSGTLHRQGTLCNVLLNHYLGLEKTGKINDENWQKVLVYWYQTYLNEDEQGEMGRYITRFSELGKVSNTTLLFDGSHIERYEAIKKEPGHSDIAAIFSLGHEEKEKKRKAQSSS